ncbi:MAG TPA: prepilin-type N-terminal cleavage/methylation domain-containing protein [Opitutaceae bacterium]|nr:prepilin-type N-terminal cleavage/methylation domain-containing protein [Opitutaceae bacterium]
MTGLRRRPLFPRAGLARLARPGRGLRRDNVGSRGGRGFTLIEVLLSLALVSVVLLAMNTFVFSMGELWGKNSDVRLFDLHVRAVTRFLQDELRTAALPPAARANSNPIGLQDIRPQNGATDKLLTFELPSGCRLFNWPDNKPLPEVVCSLQVRPGQGLILLWHSRLEKNFDTDPPRETVVSPLVTGMTYDYYDSDGDRWTNETALKLDSQGNPMLPQRLRLQFTYQKLTRETVITIPVVGQGLPTF